MSSTSDKMSGEVKQKVGNVTNNEELELKGKLEEARGNFKSNVKRMVEKKNNFIEDVKRA